VIANTVGGTWHKKKTGTVKQQQVQKNSKLQRRHQQRVHYFRSLLVSFPLPVLQTKEHEMNDHY